MVAVVWDAKVGRHFGGGGGGGGGRWWRGVDFFVFGCIKYVKSRSICAFTPSGIQSAIGENS